MSEDNDAKPSRPRAVLHGGDDNNIKMSVTIKTSIGEIDMSPLTLEFNAPLVGTEPTIGDLWASQISQEVKKAVSSVFESKYGRRRTMGFMGSYADSQNKNNANPSASADEKSYPSYEKMSKAWGADKKSADDGAEKSALIVDDGAMCRKVCGMMMQEMGFTITYAEDGKEAGTGPHLYFYLSSIYLSTYLPTYLPTYLSTVLVPVSLRCYCVAPLVAVPAVRVLRLQ